MQKRAEELGAAAKLPVASTAAAAEIAEPVAGGVSEGSVAPAASP